MKETPDDKLGHQAMLEQRKLRFFEIPRLLWIISRKYFEITKFKIKGRTVHFWGQKEIDLPQIRQSLNEILDLANQVDTQGMISLFKKFCLKSKVLSEDINSLKRLEEKEKNIRIAKDRYKGERIRQEAKQEGNSTTNRGRNMEENGHGIPQQYDGIDMATAKSIDLDKLGELFLKIENNPLKYTVLVDNFGEGNIIVLELSKAMTILIRVDSTHRIPICWWFWSYREKNRRNKLLLPESKSSCHYFRSIQELSIEVINYFVSTHDCPIIYFMEWWRAFSKFYSVRCNENENWLYWNEKHGFIPPDFALSSIPDEKQNLKIIHKPWKITRWFDF